METIEEMNEFCSKLHSEIAKDTAMKTAMEKLNDACIDFNESKITLEAEKNVLKKNFESIQRYLNQEDD